MLGQATKSCADSTVKTHAKGHPSALPFTLSPKKSIIIGRKIDPQRKQLVGSRRLSKFTERICHCLEHLCEKTFEIVLSNAGEDDRLPEEIEKL
jgi:hypothetical protein